MNSYFATIVKKIESISYRILVAILLPLIVKTAHTTHAATPKLILGSSYQTVHTHFRLLTPVIESFAKKKPVRTQGKVYEDKSQTTARKFKKIFALKQVSVRFMPHHTNDIGPAINRHSFILSTKLSMLSIKLPRVDLIKHDATWHCKKTFMVKSKYETSLKLQNFFLNYFFAPLYKKKFLNLALWQYIVLIGLVIITWIAHKIIPYFFTLIIRRFMGTSYQNQFIIERLLLTLIIIALLRIVLAMFYLQYPTSFIKRVLEAINSFVLMCFAYESVNIVQAWIRIAKQHNHFMIHILPLCSMVAKIIIILIGIVKTIQSFGFETKPLVQALSFSTLGLGLASQDTIKNLFGSLMIILDKPFSVGDEISSGLIRGKVEEIGLRATILRTKDRSLTYIPNAKLADAAYIHNFGKVILRSISLEIPLNYKVPLKLLPVFVKGLQEIAQCQPLVTSEATIYLDKMSENGFIVTFNLDLDTHQSKIEQEYKNTIIPLILQLANQLGICLGHIKHVVDMKQPAHSKKPRASKLQEETKLLKNNNNNNNL